MRARKRARPKLRMRDILRKAARYLGREKRGRPPGLRCTPASPAVTATRRCRSPVEALCCTVIGCRTQLVGDGRVFRNSAPRQGALELIGLCDMHYQRARRYQQRVRTGKRDYLSALWTTVELAEDPARARGVRPRADVPVNEAGLLLAACSSDALCVCLRRLCVRVRGCVHTSSLFYVGAHLCVYLAFIVLRGVRLLLQSQVPDVVAAEIPQGAGGAPLPAPRAVEFLGLRQEEVGSVSPLVAPPRSSSRTRARRRLIAQDARDARAVALLATEEARVARAEGRRLRALGAQ